MVDNLGLAGNATRVYTQADSLLRWFRIGRSGGRVNWSGTVRGQIRVKQGKKMEREGQVWILRLIIYRIVYELIYGLIHGCIHGTVVGSGGVDAEGGGWVAR